MPYLYRMAEITHETGIPVMRSMVLEYQDDDACIYLDKQYNALCYLQNYNYCNFINTQKNP